MSTLLADYSPPAVDRKFWLILAGSVVLHATLFLVTAWERKQGPLKMPPLLASIRLAVPAMGEAPKSAPQPVAPVPLMRASAQPAVTPPAPLAGRRAVAAIALEAPAAAQTATSTQAAASPVPSALPPILTVAESTPVAPASLAADVAAEALARYRQRLTSLLARQQTYPRIAEMRGWEGEVRLRLRVARKGQLLAVALDRSSGHAVLDEHAAAMLAELRSLPPFPEAVEGSEILVVVPINYRLNKTT